MTSGQCRFDRNLVPGGQNTGHPVKNVKSGVGRQGVGFKQKMLCRAAGIVLGNSNRGP